jgi:hypothetical protein
VFVRSVTPKHHSQHGAETQLTPLDVFALALPARCMVIQGTHTLWSVPLFTTSWPNVLRLPRVLLCSIPYAACGECSLPDNR